MDVMCRNVRTVGCGCHLQDTAVDRVRTEGALQTFVHIVGEKMTAMPMCKSCTYGNGEWKDDGICFACREQVWIPGKEHRNAWNETVHPNADDGRKKNDGEQCPFC